MNNSLNMDAIDTLISSFANYPNEVVQSEIKDVIIDNLDNISCIPDMIQVLRNYISHTTNHTKYNVQAFSTLINTLDDFNKKISVMDAFVSYLYDYEKKLGDNHEENIFEDN